MYRLWLSPNQVSEKKGLKAKGRPGYPRGARQTTQGLSMTAQRCHWVDFVLFSSEVCKVNPFCSAQTRLKTGDVCCWVTVCGRCDLVYFLCLAFQNHREPHSPPFSM